MCEGETEFQQKHKGLRLTRVPTNHNMSLDVCLAANAIAAMERRIESLLNSDNVHFKKNPENEIK